MPADCWAPTGAPPGAYSPSAVLGLAARGFWPGDMDGDTIVYFLQALSGQSGDDWHAPVISAVWHPFASVGLRSPGWVLARGVMALLAGMYLVHESG